MRQHEKELARHGVDVKIVTFDVEFMALAYIKETALKWPLLLDSQQELYQAYGLQRGGWWSLYNPEAIWKYLKLILRGRFPGRPGRDWQQLGGDVIIDPDGIVRLCHVSTGPHDRPEVETMMALVTGG